MTIKIVSGRVAVASLLLIIAAAGLVGVARAADNVLAEFGFDPDWGAAVVPMTFNGATYNFDINTATSHSSFDSRLSALLTKIPRTAEIMTSQGNRRSAVYRSPEGAIGPIKVPSLEPVWCRDHAGRGARATRIDGCLGMDAIRQFVIRFDYDRGRISFLRTIPRDAGARVPLEKTALNCPSIRGSIGGTPRNFLVATGGQCYGAGFLRTSHFNELASRREISLIAQIVDEGNARIARHPAYALGVPVTIGPYRHVALVFSDFENTAWSGGVLGVGYLRRYLVTFDFPNHAVYLAPSAQFHQIDGMEWAGGLRLRRDGGLVVVTATAGLGKRAGVQPDDVLERADGYETRGMQDIDIMRHLLKSDRPTTLVFRRPKDGRTIRLSYDLQTEKERVLRRLTNGRHAAIRGEPSADAGHGQQ